MQVILFRITFAQSLSLPNANVSSAFERNSAPSLEARLEIKDKNVRQQNPSLKPSSQRCQYACRDQRRGDKAHNNPKLFDWFLQHDNDQDNCDESGTDVDTENSKLVNQVLK